MTLDLHRHARRSIRLRGYDYAQTGTYFVTICTRNHACLFGEVMDGKMRVNDMGRLVQDEWLRTGTMRPHVSPGRPQVAPTRKAGHAIRRGDLRSPRPCAALFAENRPTPGLQRKHAESGADKTSST